MSFLPAIVLEWSAKIQFSKGSDSVRKLEKQYEQLCRLREQVQIAESRQRVSLRDMSQDPASLKRRRSQDNPH